MTEKNSTHIARKGANDKLGTTITLVESMSREVIPLKLIYKGKANRLLQAGEFPVAFVLTYNKKH